MLTSVEDDLPGQSRDQSRPEWRAQAQAQAQVLRVLGDPLRMRIIELLAVEQLCTCHLVAETGARQTNVSNHLRALREAGVVEADPAGRYTYYRLVPAALDALADLLGGLAEGARGTSDVRRPSCD